MRCAKNSCVGNEDGGPSLQITIQLLANILRISRHIGRTEAEWHRQVPAEAASRAHPAGSGRGKMGRPFPTWQPGTGAAAQLGRQRSQGRAGRRLDSWSASLGAQPSQRRLPRSWPDCGRRQYYSVRSLVSPSSRLIVSWSSHLLIAPPRARKNGAGERNPTSCSVATRRGTTRRPR